MKRLGLLLACLGVASGSPAAAQSQSPIGFDHVKHQKLFPDCTSCHGGAATAGRPIWPTTVSCADCHDGKIKPAVVWTPRLGRYPSNLRFEHARHREGVAAKAPGADRTPSQCASCHGEPGVPRMQIQRTVLSRCFDCHQIKTEHFAAPDSNCAKCHTPLAESRDLPDARIRRFATPPSHKVLGFMTRGPTGHGALAKPASGTHPPMGVAASCATCHARDFCVVCHVNAPETATIQALAADPRSLLLKAELKKPANHDAPDFGTKHGRGTGPKAEACATCHTRESCTTCHAATLPRPASFLAVAGPGRGAGATTVRRKPETHTPDFREHHSRVANTAPATCYSCHARTMCLDCHRPDPARAPGFHSSAFIARHPSAAYNRETNCTDCHNPQQFCQSCHRQASLGARGRLGTNPFHDAKRSFLSGHGQAARQNLESCVTCHVERDCLSCHSAASGRRLSPHGPGFDPNRLRLKNPEMCIACHGRNIPTR